MLKDIKDKTSTNSRQLDILIKINFFEEFGNINLLLYQADIFDKFNSCKTLKKDKLKELDVDENLVRDCCEKETEKSFSKIDNNKLIKKLSAQNITTSSVDIIKYQIQLLGYTNIVDDNMSGSIYICKSIQTTKFGTFYINLYRPFDGVSMECKINKNWYSECPCEQGDALDCIFRWKPKRKKDKNGKWIETGETERVLQVYKKI